MSGLLLALALLAGPVHAETPLELRAFTDVSPRVDRGWPVRPFLRFESRFRETGLVYEKTSLGGRATLAPWLDASLYYAHTDVLSSGDHDELAVADAILHHDFGPISLKVRLGNEWHAPADFYRYRQLHELRVTAWKAVAPWVQEEFRVDADEGRITMHNLLGGADIPLGSAGRLGVQVDWELSRRGKDEWSGVLAPGLVFASIW